MALLTYKYTPTRMPDNELEATFAAREHTVDYLLKSLRDQIHSRTLSSFLLTGPRGAGKSTIIRMVAMRIGQDPQLNRAWLPIAFPEEQFSIASLRDFLSAILRELVELGAPKAKDWLKRVESEANDEQSQQFAVTGLREITRAERKRLVVFVENLNLLLQESLDDQMKGTLRRLLMSEPFMMLIGSSVHVFDSLKRYDEAFFNYFGAVPLDRLDAEQVFELLRRRAEFDGNHRFLQALPQQRPKIRAIAHLSGGNPRLILMLYELLSQRQVTTIAQYLSRLLDELTPLLKDEMESLPPQQRKIIHALMERGGTAQPADLVERTRLPLNAITTQLKRLKDTQIVEVLGGGKGRAANYTVPDKLFAIWYQMRYLNQNRRRIELFVEVLRVWFEAKEQHSLVQDRTKSDSVSSGMLRETAHTMEPLYTIQWVEGQTDAADRTLDLLNERLRAESTERGTVRLVEFLAALTESADRGAWVHAARRLLAAQPPESRQALAFIEPVCAILQGGDRNLLDPLPPEQREFARDVIAGFETAKAA